MTKSPSIAGPQLVVPVMNARLRAERRPMPAGAACTTRFTAPMRSPRTTAPPETPGFNIIRAAKVVARAKGFLDASFPLKLGSFTDATGFRVQDGVLVVAPAGWRGPAAKTRRNSPAIMAMPPTPPRSC